MELTIQDSGSPTIVAVSGNIDTNTAPQFEVFTSDLVNGGVDNLQIDLTDCSFVSSAGLRAIVTLQKRLIDGTLVFTHVSQDVMDVFEMTGFDKILTFA